MMTTGWAFSMQAQNSPADWIPPLAAVLPSTTRLNACCCWQSKAWLLTATNSKKLLIKATLPHDCCNLFLPVLLFHTAKLCLLCCSPKSNCAHEIRESRLVFSIQHRFRTPEQTTSAKAAHKPHLPSDVTSSPSPHTPSPITFHTSATMASR